MDHPEHRVAADDGLAPSLRDAVYDRLYARILSGDWPEGARLPSEVALAAQLGVSRPLLREALMRLRHDGIVESRQGAGSWVRRVPPSVVLDLLPAGDVADVLACYEFREGLEGEVAALAAVRATPSQLAGLEAVVRRMAALAERPEALGDDEDVAFHLALAEAADNAHYLAAVTGALEVIRTGIRIAGRLPHWSRAERIALSVREHGAILAALRARDRDEARRLMRLHISRSRARVFLGRVDRPD